VQSFLDAIRGDGPRAAQLPGAAPRAPEKEASSVRGAVLVLGGILVLLVALGTLVLATSAASGPRVATAQAPRPQRPELPAPPDASAAPRSRQATGDKQSKPARGQAVARADALPPVAEQAVAESPLTQAFLDEWTAYAEWLLDIRLTPSQRRECQQCWARSWQAVDSGVKDRFLAHANAELRWLSEVVSQSVAAQDDLRAEKRPAFLAGLRQSRGLDDRLLLGLYEAAHRPGGKHNPILVAGTPSLAQAQVDQWRRFTEWALDVRLTDSQRLEFQRLFVKQWRELDPVGKDGFVKENGPAVLSRLPLLSPSAGERLRVQHQARLLAGLRQGGDDELSRWLLAVYGRERDARRQQLVTEKVAA
jgi:hypothetical protein